MHVGKSLKSSRGLPFRRRGQAGLVLVDNETRETLTLDAVDAALWSEWPEHSQACELLGRVLAAKGFANDRACGDAPGPLTYDNAVFLPAGRYVKWLRESPGLVVLFNTASMAQNNPLLVLGPYGSLCWNGVVAGWSVGRIRHEAWRVFGADEATPFLARLKRLGFIVGDASLPEDSCREAVTKEFPAPDIQFQIVQSRVPWYCLWELCRECDLRCKVCYQPDFTHVGLGLAETEKVAHTLIDAGVFYVCLLGGEPLLRTDLEGVIAQLRANGVFAKIITNGQRLTRTRALSLAAAGLNLVEVSFDGLSVHTHDVSRGDGAFMHSLAALRNCKEAGIPRSGVVWTLHSGNLHELPNLPSFLDAHSVSECYLSLFKRTGLNGATAPWQSPKTEDLDRVRATIAEWRTTHPHLGIVLLPSCSCGRTSVVIGSDGNVRLCSFAYNSVGNVRKTALLDIWRSLESGLPESGPLGFCQTVNLCHKH